MIYRYTRTAAPVSLASRTEHASMISSQSTCLNAELWIPRSARTAISSDRVGLCLAAAPAFHRLLDYEVSMPVTCCTSSRATVTSTLMSAPATLALMMPAAVSRLLIPISVTTLTSVHVWLVSRTECASTISSRSTMGSALCWRVNNWASLLVVLGVGEGYFSIMWR